MRVSAERLLIRIAAALAGAVVVLALGWFAWVKAPASPSADVVQKLHVLETRACTSVEIVGVRGHSDPPSSVGPDVQALILRLEARLLGAARLSVLSLPYEEGPTLWVVPISVPRDITAGARALEQYLEARAAACPDEHEVVIGQSEGAALTHLTLPRIPSSVVAVVLLGDPLHLGSAAYDVDLGPTSNGALLPWMGLSVDLSARRWADPVPADLAAKVRSYCLTHDRVCGMNLLDLHPSTHVTYRNNPEVPGHGRGVLDLAVDFIIARLGTAAGREAAT